MPPKKTKAQKSSQSSQPSQRQTRSISREPSAEPQRQTRAGRKRRLSDSPNVSEQLASSQAQATPSKRRKRGTAEAELEHERLHEVIEEESEVEFAAETTAGAEVEETALYNRHVHFGGSSLQEEDFDMDQNTIHSTPHVRKIAIKRRSTGSPHLSEGDSTTLSRRQKRTSVRHSLPGESQDGSRQVIVEQREYAPLKEVLEERMLARAKHDAENGAMVLPDDQMMVLASQEIVYSQLPDAENPDLDIIEDSKADTDISLRLSQMRSQEVHANTEREGLRDKIVTLSRQAAEATHKLECFQIEVEGLGFGEEEDDTAAILESIRNSFMEVRASLQVTFPGIAIHDASNGTLLEILVSKLRELSALQKTQDGELLEQSTLVADLEKQVQGLIDHLAESQAGNDRLTGLWNLLDKANDEKTSEIKALQDEVDEIASERDTFEDKVFAKERELKESRDENVELAGSIDRLTATLQRYREEETRLTDLITKMEEEHTSSIGKMAREREETVRELEDRLDEQMQLCTNAEEQGVQRQAAITSLELQIEDLQADLDATRNELQERSHEVGDLEDRVTQLEGDLDELNLQLAQLRELNELERSEKEALQADLDERDVEIEKLNSEIRNQGVQANELRQKLFQVQQENEQRVQELEVAASERDEQYQSDIAVEVERRERADVLSQEHAGTIEQLEIRLEEVEQEMRDLLAQRAQRIEELEQEVADKDEDIEVLRAQLQEARDRYEEETEQATYQREQQEENLDTLRAKIDEQEEKIASLREEATALVESHDVEVDNRNGHIAELNHSIADLTNQVADLVREKDGLERRVEQEAEQMLTFSNEKSDELEALKATILDKQQKILNVEQKAVEADRSWQEVCNAKDEDIAARDEEISMLRASNEEQTQTILTWKSNFETLQRSFRNYVQDDRDVTKEHLDEAAALLARLEQAKLKKQEEAAEALRWSESVEADISTHTTTTTANLQEEVTQKKTRGRKKRVVDSAIGMDESMLAQ